MKKIGKLLLVIFVFVLLTGYPTIFTTLYKEEDGEGLIYKDLAS